MLVFGHLEGAHTIQNLLPTRETQPGHSNPSLPPLRETVYKAVTKYRLRFKPHLIIHSEINEKILSPLRHWSRRYTLSPVSHSVFHQSLRQGNFPQCSLNSVFHEDILLPRWGMSCIFRTRSLRTEHTETASGGPRLPPRPGKKPGPNYSVCSLHCQTTVLTEESLSLFGTSTPLQSKPTKLRRF